MIGLTVYSHSGRLDEMKTDIKVYKFHIDAINGHWYVEDNWQLLPLCCRSGHRTRTTGFR